MFRYPTENQLKRARLLHPRLLALSKEMDMPIECFDCGKKLTPDEAVFQVDSKGWLIFCTNDCIKHADQKLFWRRLLTGKSWGGK